MNSFLLWIEYDEFGYEIYYEFGYEIYYVERDIHIIYV